MRTYWSCTKLADKLRGSVKPPALTQERWEEWERQSKQKHPIRHWIAEGALDSLQRCLFFPFTKIRDIRAYVRNRWYDRLYSLTSSQLKKGSYYEIDTRILYCLFDELVRFVEGECASWALAINEDLKKLKMDKSFLGVNYLIEQGDTEIVALYKWWKFVYPCRIDIGSLPLGVYWKTEKEYEKEDTEMLVRLIKVRHRLWT